MSFPHLRYVRLDIARPHVAFFLDNGLVVAVEQLKRRLALVQDLRSQNLGVVQQLHNFTLLGRRWHRLALFALDRDQF